VKLQRPRSTLNVPPSDAFGANAIDAEAKVRGFVFVRGDGLVRRVKSFGEQELRSFNVTRNAAEEFARAQPHNMFSHGGAICGPAVMPDKPVQPCRAYKRAGVGSCTIR
jgi:hypothetical protein